MAPADAASADAISALGHKALDEAAKTVESLLAAPEWALDPASKEASSAADSARSFLKLFFDAAQAHSPPAVRAAAAGLDSLVVDGFTREQIWEELQVQNVPLRRHLRRHVAALAGAPEGRVTLVLDGSEVTPSSASKAAKPADAKVKGKAALPEKKKKKAAQEADEMEDEDEEEVAEPKATKSQKKKKGKRAKEAEDDEADDPEEPGDGAEAKDLYDEDEMHRFADLGDQGKLRLDLEADGSSDFDELEIGDDDEEDEAAKGARFSDFFDPAARRDERGGRSRKASKAGKGADSEDDDGDGELEDVEEEAGLDDDEEDEEEVQIGDGGADDLSDEERELEEKIKQLQREAGGGGEEDDDDHGEGEEEEEAPVEDEEDEEGAEAPSRKAKSLYEMDQRLASLEEEVAKLEEEQLQEKPWLMKGEVSAKQRPLNSLLEVHLDQPMTQLAARNAEYAAGAGGAQEGDNEEGLEDTPGAEKLSKGAKAFDVEAIIRQRVWDEAFDDVERKEAVRPADRPQGAEDDAVESLNFEKSRIGLGDVYAKQYEAEILGAKTDGEAKEDKEKTETKALFAKLMHKLDLLTNSHFTPRPPSLGMSGEQLSKVGSIKMEETIPLLISDATLKAPEELKAPRRHEKDHEELDHEERAAVRRAKKARRRKGLEGRVESGEMSLAGMRDRDKKLAEKNAEAKKEKAAKFVAKEAKKRIRSTELLSQAAASATGDASRKEESRKQRQERPDGAPSSKRLKL